MPKLRRLPTDDSDSGYIAKSQPKAEKSLTEAEVRRILRQEDSKGGASTSTGQTCAWVRRSSRQPNRSLVKSSGVRDLLDKLKSNDSDMVVLKLKKYLNDSDCPQVVMNAALEAMEENTNCQALYIQVSIETDGY